MSGRHCGMGGLSQDRAETRADSGFLGASPTPFWGGAVVMPQNTWMKCPLLAWKASWDWPLWPLEFWWRGNPEHISPVLERNLSLCKSEKTFCLSAGSVHTLKKATRVRLLRYKLRTTLGTAHLQDPVPEASLSHCPGTVDFKKEI